MDTIHRLTLAGEYKDRDTADHVERIDRFSEVVARGMGLPAKTVDVVRNAAPLHDVGKVGIPDAILLKPGRLDPDEWAVMRAHTTRGAQILAHWGSDVIQMGASIALAHHERWDGGGYPNGIGGQEIPLEARICAVVDFFDGQEMLNLLAGVGDRLHLWTPDVVRQVALCRDVGMFDVIVINELQFRHAERRQL